MDTGGRMWTTLPCRRVWTFVPHRTAGSTGLASRTRPQDPDDDWMSQNRVGVTRGVEETDGVHYGDEVSQVFVSGSVHATPCDLSLSTYCIQNRGARVLDGLYYS